jgi:hypothetical protein
MPNDPDKALAIAKGLPGVVQTIFVGDEVHNRQAVEFMARLARENGGQAVSRRLGDPQFESSVRQLLGLPSPVSS